MLQLMDDGQAQPVAEFSLFRLPSGARQRQGATVVATIETALPSQNDRLTRRWLAKARRCYPFAFCNPGWLLCAQ